MAIEKPEVEWFYDPSTYWKEYGVICLSGKWAAVQATGYAYHAQQDYKVLTEWVDDRKTAIGFLKLLRGQP